MIRGLYLKHGLIWKHRKYGSVIYDPLSERAIKLNRMGTLIFIYLVHGHLDADRIATTLSNEFDVTKEEAMEDISNLITTLKDSGVFASDYDEKGTINLFKLPSPLDSCALIVTDECNLDCKHCFRKWFERSNEILSYEEIKKLINDLAIANIFNLEVTGGEPLLRKDIVEIIRYADHVGVPVTLFTNGTLLTDDIIRALKDCNLCVRISINSPEEHHDFLCGSGTYNTAISAVTKLVKAGIRTEISTCVSRKNLKSYKSIVELSENLGVSHLSFGEIIVPENVSSGKELALTPSESAELTCYVLNAAVKHPIINPIHPLDFFMENTDKREMCGAGRNSCAVTPSGDVIPCQLLRYKELVGGNIRENSLIDIWSNSHVFKMLRGLSVDKFEGCSECSIRYLCGGGCRGISYLRSGVLSGSQDPSFCSAQREVYSRVNKDGEI